MATFGTFVSGQVLTAAELNTIGVAWSSHTPTLAQGASSNIAKTVDRSRYITIGKIVIWSFSISPTASGTAGSAVTLTLPVTAAAALSQNLGGCSVYDSSTTTRYTCSAELTSTTTVGFVNDASGASLWGGLPNLAIASGDAIRGTIIYEAA